MALHSQIQKWHFIEFYDHKLTSESFQPTNLELSISAEEPTQIDPVSKTLSFLVSRIPDDG
jgi:hypothetical protein